MNKARDREGSLLWYVFKGVLYVASFFGGLFSYWFMFFYVIENMPWVQFEDIYILFRVVIIALGFVGWVLYLLGYYKLLRRLVELLKWDWLFENWG